MKSWFNYTFILCVLSLGLISCEKDEDRTVLKVGTAPVLTATATEAVLTKDNASDKAVTFSWNPVDYGYQAAVNYTIEYALEGTDFASPQKMEAVSATTKDFTVSELNAMVSKLKLSPNNPADVEFRIKSDISEFVEPLYSEPVTMTVTPYLDIIDYPSLYVPGQYQGWSPDRAPKISSIDDNGVYEGYAYMNVADGFKFTSKPGWDGTNYGDGGAGKLSTDGGAGNLTVSSPGYYLLKANTNDLTWSATKTNWGVTGSATPNGWASDTTPDHDLVYDENAKVLKVTLPLKAGAIKFRANDAWNLNYGDAKPADGFVDAGGADIEVTEAGTYEIILNLSIPGYYSYSLIKQ